MNEVKAKNKKENIVEKNKKKFDESVDKFKRLLKNKKGIKMFGFVFVVMGFIMGYAGGIMAEYSQLLSDSFIVMGNYIMILGMIFLMYFFLGFNKKSDKQKTEKEEEEDLVEEIISSTELSSHDESMLDKIEASIENKIEDVKNDSNKEEDGW